MLFKRRKEIDKPKITCCNPSSQGTRFEKTLFRGSRRTDGGLETGEGEISGISMNFECNFG